MVKLKNQSKELEISFIHTEEDIDVEATKGATLNELIISITDTEITIWKDDIEELGLKVKIIENRHEGN